MPAPLITTFLAAAAIMVPIDHGVSVAFVTAAVVIQIVLFVLSAIVTQDELG